MNTAKGTTPKSLKIKLQQEEATNFKNGVCNGESSFRVLYYGSASAGSVPFMWESQPGTPKHALTESSLPPLTPPPSYNHNQLITPNYNNNSSSKRSAFLRSVFLSSSRKHSGSPRSFSSCSSSSSSSSHLQSTPVRKAEDCGGGGSPTSTLCFGGGFTKGGYKVKKVKKAMLSFVRHGKP